MFKSDDPLRRPSIPADFGVSKVLHANPRHDHPDPCHDTGQDYQSWVVTHDGQGWVVLELWRRIRRLAYVPGPAPDIETGSHPYHKDEPCDRKHNPTPPLRLRIIPVSV